METERKLMPGLTSIVYDGQVLSQLEGAVTLPVGARIQIESTDYIVNSVRVSIRTSNFDIYYDTHIAEVTGGQPNFE
jgi:hypothetical protein